MCLCQCFINNFYMIMFMLLGYMYYHIIPMNELLKMVSIVLPIGIGRNNYLVFPGGVH